MSITIDDDLGTSWRRYPNYMEVEGEELVQVSITTGNDLGTIYNVAPSCSSFFLSSAVADRPSWRRCLTMWRWRARSWWR